MFVLKRYRSITTEVPECQVFQMLASRINYFFDRPSSSCDFSVVGLPSDLESSPMLLLIPQLPEIHRSRQQHQALRFEQGEILGFPHSLCTQKKILL